MRRVFVALVILLAALLPLGAPAYAQTPPHVFVGEATLDGLPVSDGTVIRAVLDGLPLPKAQATVKDGKYTLFVEQPVSPVVSFAIGDSVAQQTAQWETGGASVLNLAASSQLPTLRLRVDSPPPEQVTVGDQFTLAIKANTGLKKALRGEISIRYNPSVFQVERDKRSLSAGPAQQIETGAGLYRARWDYASPFSTATVSGDLASIHLTVLKTAPPGSTPLTVRAGVISSEGQPFELDPSVLTYRVNVAGLPGDFNEDNTVNIVDLATLGTVWGMRVGEAGFQPRFDIDQDGLIGVGDLVSLLRNYQLQNFDTTD